MVNKSEHVFHDENFSYAACQWLEYMSEETGRHIHQAQCGHGGERQLDARCKIDSYEPTTKTVYEYNGCKWHGCYCQPKRNGEDEKRYTKTQEKERMITQLGYNLVTAWECEKPPKPLL